MPNQTHIRDAGAFIETYQPYVRDGATWREPLQTWVRDASTFRLVYSRIQWGTNTVSKLKTFYKAAGSFDVYSIRFGSGGLTAIKEEISEYVNESGWHWSRWEGTETGSLWQVRWSENSIDPDLSVVSAMAQDTWYDLNVSRIISVEAIGLGFPPPPGTTADAVINCSFRYKTKTDIVNSSTYTFRFTNVA